MDNRHLRENMRVINKLSEIEKVGEFERENMDWLKDCRQEIS
jgi:hypothetical protein